MVKLSKPLYHGTSAHSAIMIYASGTGLKAPVYLTESKKDAEHYAKAAPAMYEALKVIKDGLENNQNNEKEALQFAVRSSLFIINKALAKAVMNVIGKDTLI